jgi:hypothetical protein
MATNRDLLKEAIADAKSVKETAIANAKLALEEAFTPHLKSMLAAKLDEMDSDDDKLEEKKDEEKVKESEETVDEADAVSFRRKNSPSYNSDPEGGPVNPVPHKVGKSTVQEEEIDEEIDLDELLAELEDSKDLSEKKDSDEEKKDVKEDARTDAEEEGFLDGEKDEKEDMEDKIDDEEVDLEDMSEDDLKGFIEDVIKDMVADGEIEPGDEFVEDEVEVEDVEDIEVEDDVDVDVEIDEMKKPEDEVKKEEVELDEMSDPVMRKGDKEKKDGKFEKESKPQIDTEEDRLKEALAAINELKAELNEVNLLNAKLLYTNKIFKAKNLTESKKVKVLKAFDNAKDVKQAKTIFETLNEGLIDNSSINKVKGSASKASGLEPKAVKQPIIESNDVYNRMRKLAGLI